MNVEYCIIFTDQEFRIFTIQHADFSHIMNLSSQNNMQAFISRNYRLNRNGHLANFFSYVCNGKNIKELLASTLNRIAASVRCVRSMVVVLNAKLTD